MSSLVGTTVTAARLSNTPSVFSSFNNWLFSDSIARVSTGHKRLVRESFTRQAEDYAASPSISDPERVWRLVEAVNPPPHARALDVATGPGYLAMGFAERCREVVGVDLTEAPLEIARALARERSLQNVRFEISDADRLPFAKADFDLVVCRLAFHHFQDPQSVLNEMVRVCGHAGTIAVEDLIASEFAERADYQNQFERLRDPSHTRALPLSDLLNLFRAAGLELIRFYSGELMPNLEQWLANSQTPPEAANEVRRMIAEDAARDLSGCRPFKNDGGWGFRQLTAAVVARKLD